MSCAPQASPATPDKQRSICASSTAAAAADGDGQPAFPLKPAPATVALTIELAPAPLTSQTVMSTKKQQKRTIKRYVYLRSLLTMCD